MTSEQKKEQLSIHVVGTIATLAGCKVSLPAGFATGVDISVNQVYEMLLFDKKRLVDTGCLSDFQLKTTTRKSIALKKDKAGKTSLYFDLEVKNYNDLVFRQQSLANEKGKHPLFLLLLVLPDKEEDWLKVIRDAGQADNHLKLGGLVYWYYPGKGAEFCKNNHWKRIKIPVENVADVEFFKSLLIY